MKLGEVLSGWTSEMLQTGRPSEAAFFNSLHVLLCKKDLNRRNFLRLSGLTAVGLATASCAPDGSSPPSNPTEAAPGNEVQSVEELKEMALRQVKEELGSLTTTYISAEGSPLALNSVEDLDLFYNKVTGYPIAYVKSDENQLVLVYKQGLGKDTYQDVFVRVKRKEQSWQNPEVFTVFHNTQDESELWQVLDGKLERKGTLVVAEGALEAMFDFGDGENSFTLREYQGFKTGEQVLATETPDANTKFSTRAERVMCVVGDGNNMVLVNQVEMDALGQMDLNRATKIERGNRDLGYSEQSYLLIWGGENQLLGVIDSASGFKNVIATKIEEGSQVKSVYRFDGASYLPLLDKFGPVTGINMVVTGEGTVVTGWEGEAKAVITSDGRQLEMMGNRAYDRQNNKLFVWREGQLIEESWLVDTNTYTTNPDEVPDQYRDEFNNALPMLEQEPGIKAFSKRLNKTVYIAYGVSEVADKIVGVWNFDNSNQVYRAYGYDNMVFMTATSDKNRYLVRKKSGDGFVEDPQGYLLLVNAIRGAMIVNASERFSDINLPQEAFEEDSLYFVLGEGREIFGGSYTVKTYGQNVTLPISEVKWIRVVPGDGVIGNKATVQSINDGTVISVFTVPGANGGEMLKLGDYLGCAIEDAGLRNLSFGFVNSIRVFNGDISTDVEENNRVWYLE